MLQTKGKCVQPDTRPHPSHTDASATNHSQKSEQPKKTPPVLPVSPTTSKSIHVLLTKAWLCTASDNPSCLTRRDRNVTDAIRWCDPPKSDSVDDAINSG